jgi:hypothetical protein
LNHLCGPSARYRPNSQLFSCAQSRDQAAIEYDQAIEWARRAIAIAPDKLPFVRAGGIAALALRGRDGRAAKRSSPL